MKTNKIFMLFILLCFMVVPSLHAESPSEVNYDQYIDSDGSMSAAYEALIDAQSNLYIRKILATAHDFATQDIRYKFGSSSFTKTRLKKNSKPVTTIDCSGLVHEIFEDIGLDYPFASSQDMVRLRPNLFEHFEIQKIKNQQEAGFRPKTGDILAFNIPVKSKNGSVKYKGHVVLVIDPKECVAINATSVVWPDEDSKIDRSKNGVYFQKVVKGNCNNGLWKSWDTSKNNFQVLLRNKNFIGQEMPADLPTLAPIEINALELQPVAEL